MQELLMKIFVEARLFQIIISFFALIFKQNNYINKK